MARTRPAERLDQLAVAALAVFKRKGFKQTLMADVAEEMGVSAGLLYTYVESKEALFDLVVRHTLIDDPSWLDAIEIPVRTPEPGSTVEFLRGVFGRRGQWPRLEAALKLARADDPRAELGAVVDEQYQLMMRHRMGLLLLMCSTLEFPGLTEVFVLGLRKKLLAHFVRYIDSRVAARQFRKPKDTFACAAVLTSAIAWANLQRPFDPGFTALDEETTQEATTEFIVNSLLPND